MNRFENLSTIFSTKSLLIKKFPSGSLNMLLNIFFDALEYPYSQLCKDQNFFIYTIQLM